MMKAPRRLLLATVAVLALPWLAGALAKSQLQPGLADDPQRSALLVDFIVAGAMFSGLSLVAVYAVGLWIVAVMKGPRREADSFPVDTPRR
jgi:hypothetical protein